jgi:hypothetical protein
MIVTTAQLYKVAYGKFDAVHASVEKVTVEAF